MTIVYRSKQNENNHINAIEIHVAYSSSSSYDCILVFVDGY